MSSNNQQEPDANTINECMLQVFELDPSKVIDELQDDQPYNMLYDLVNSLKSPRLDGESVTDHINRRLFSALDVFDSFEALACENAINKTLQHPAIGL